jgi:hypothetical protein
MQRWQAHPCRPRLSRCWLSSEVSAKPKSKLIRSWLWCMTVISLDDVISTLKVLQAANLESKIIWRNSNHVHY